MSGEAHTRRPSESPEEFGYEQSLKRDFGAWSVFALAIAFISPIVALYAIFGLAFAAGGPAFWWGFLVVLAGQATVAMVFAELVSLWPLEGSVYQWTRQMVGNGFGWFAGWAYIWTLLIAMASVSYGTASFLAPLLGFNSPSNTSLVLVACAVLAFATLANTVARKALRVMVALSVVASILASAVLGTILLIFYRENSLATVLDSFGAGGGESFYLTGPFLAAVAIVGWAFVGFESAGAVAEEVEDPQRNIPKAVIFSILIVGVLVIYTGLAIILAIPDLGAVVAGQVEDPIRDTLADKLGAGITKPLFAMIVVGFAASLIAIQTSVSRFIFSFGRDRAIPAGAFFEKVATRDRLPVNAVVASALIAAAFFLLSGSNVYATLVAFTTVGFYIAFAFPVLAALWLRLRRRWTPGRFNFGRLGYPLNVIAAVWLVLEIVNIAWPRASELPWYENWGTIIMLVVLGIVGAVAYSLLRNSMQELKDVSEDSPDDVNTSGPEEPMEEATVDTSDR